MNDYISRQAAIEAVHNHFDEGGFNCYDDGQMMLDKIMDLPAAPVREAKRGRWINCGGNIGNYIKCAICGTVYAEPVTHAVYPWNFCANCGADMRGKNDD